MTDARVALRGAAAALLAARGAHPLAALVARAEVELTTAEAWSMGSRSVSAHRVALALGPDDYVALGRDPENFEELRSAFAQAMRSPDTELSELFVLVKLPEAGGTWQSVYRTAPVTRSAGPPSAVAVRAAAIALLDAAGDDEAARALERAELEVSEVGQSTSSEAQSRFVVRWTAEEVVAMDRSPALTDLVTRAIRRAGVRADRLVADVVVAPLVEG